MAEEIEIKLRIDDLQSFQRKLRAIGARFARVGLRRVHEYNLLFDTADGSLAKREQLLRLRTETPEQGKGNRASFLARVVVTFKRPVEGGIGRTGTGEQAVRHKIREEIEAEVANADDLLRVFDGMGMRVWFRYEKFRTTYCLPDSKRWARRLLIELDETPIGTFVELEGPSSAIDRAAKELGFAEADYISTNYLSLYRQECERVGVVPRDMMFSNGRRQYKIKPRKKKP